MTSYDPETADLFDELWDARLIRLDAQVQRIDSTAYYLGRQLTHHEITRVDVDRRLKALCDQRDPDVGDFMVGLVPWDIAKDTALAGLRRGMRIDR